MILFGFINESVGSRFGFPLLFLDPEYLGKVNFLSFFIVGIAAGGFLMIWQITTYILHAWRFPFLATLNEPFIKFCINNSLLPISFVVVFAYRIVSFQHENQLMDNSSKLIDLLGLFSGIVLITIVTITYFFSTNKNALSWLETASNNHPKTKIKTVKISLIQKAEQELEDENKQIRVDYFFNTPFNIRHTRLVDHYKPELIQHVYKQHYFNMLFIEISTIIMMLVFGSLMEMPLFRIPAGASIFLFMSVITILIGAFSYLLRGWRTTMFIVFFVILNILSKFDLTDTKNKFFGLKYTDEGLPYNAQTLGAMADTNLMKYSSLETIKILNNWKAKQNNYLTTEQKPYMIFLNVSGGGLRSAYWTFNVMQYLDSITHGKAMMLTQLITGGSGGMLGASFYRELYYQSQLNNNVKLNDNEWRNAVGSDLLNPIASTIAVNDLFMPWQTYDYANQTYKKDRGYMFEQQLIENSFGLLNKKVMDYRKPEFESKIPMMILNGTVVNDGRTLMISPQPLNYMVRPFDNEQRIADPKIDAIDFRYFFKTKQADSLRFTSALRVNCTFPYVLPSMSLPTKPKLDVMDAGIRDNYGFETSIRFFSVFKKWITENTSGVIFIQVTDINRSNMKLEDNEQSALSQLTSPIGNVFYNFPEFQYYHQNNLLNLTNKSFAKSMYVIRFEYTPNSQDERASLSFHLTTKEKQSLRAAIYNKQNQLGFDRVKKLIHQ